MAANVLQSALSIFPHTQMKPMSPKILLAVMLMAITSPALAVSAGGTVSTVATVVLIAVVLILYMIPTWIASTRKNPMTTEIGLLNFFFGWTVLMWALLFLWAALSQDKKETPNLHDPDSQSRPNVLSKGAS